MNGAGHVHLGWDVAFGLASSADFVHDDQGVSFIFQLTMAKAKASKEVKNAKSHLKARLEYLQQAANYLQNASIYRDRPGSTAVNGDASEINDAADGQPTPQATCPRNGGKFVNSTTVSAGQQATKKPLTNLSRVSIHQMRGVSLKTQTRLPIPVKRSYCKRCDTLFTPGVNCVYEISNASRERKKPWADVLVVRCLVCGTEKRFPQTERRSKKLSERRSQLNQQDETCPS